MPAANGPVSTIEELLALPEDDLRHELLDGEHYVTPAPRLDHQAIVGELLFLLMSALRERRDLRVFSGPADVVLDRRTLVQPDVFVILSDPENPARHWSEIGLPVLVIEVLSSSTATLDRGKKRRVYQRAGVAEYWIVDPDARLVERWTPDDEHPEIVDGVLEWTPPNGTLIGIDLPQMFDKV